MSIRGHRVGRSQQEKNSYFNAIKNTESTSTVVEKSSLLPSDQEGEDASIVNVNRKRPGSTKYDLIEHFKSHWIEYAIGILVFAGVYFVTDSKISFARIDATLKHFEDFIRDVKSDIKDLTKRSGDQDIKIQTSLDKVDATNQRVSDLKVEKRR